MTMNSGVFAKNQNMGMFLTTISLKNKRKIFFCGLQFYRLLIPTPIVHDLRLTLLFFLLNTFMIQSDVRGPSCFVWYQGP